jgi:predicted ribosome quality control (RQC) complex YloA/Tae2 family protein
MSGIELKHVTAKLNNTLAGYYVNNVYLLNSNDVLIRLHHSEKREARLILSSTKGLWLSRYEVPRTSGGIASKLRKEISRRRIRMITQPNCERISVIELGEEMDIRRVIVEFFGGGNIIVTDGEGMIRLVLRRLRVRHRTLKPGERYKLPPPRGIDATTLIKRDLEPIQETDLSASQWLGRNLSLSKKYIEEILARSGVEHTIQGHLLSDKDVSTIYDTLREVVQQVVSGDIEPTVTYRNGVPIDAAPFRLESYQGEKSVRFKTFLDGLDEVLTNEVISEVQEVGFKGLRSKIEEIQQSIRQQLNVESESQRSAEALRAFAMNLQEVSSQTFLEGETTDILRKMEVSELSSKKGRLTLKISDATVETGINDSPMKVSSEIFAEAKRLEEKVGSIRNARSKLENELERLQEKLRSRVMEAEADEPKISREKAWYERYRWFRTSDGLLAIGGRDASSNSTIIRRYMDDNDFIFHADIHGSPFFVLKGDPKPDKSVIETAQAVVTFSRAWKEGLAAVDAYWIHPHQVKKQAPSGMFLAKGSFMIEGHKNYLHDVNVECAVGLTTIDKDLKVMAGPPDAVRRNSVAYVVLIPDRVKISDTAKKVRSELIGILDEDTAFIKQIPLDDFVRSLPSGGGRIIMKGRGEQKYKFKLA